MSNMSACRFQNTAQDLKDCLDNWDDNKSKDEQEAQQEIIEMAKDIVDLVS